MLKYIYGSFLILLFLATNHSFGQPTSNKDKSLLTKAEDFEARDLAVQFTLRFMEARDLAPIVKTLYFNDFVERYKKSKDEDIKAKEHNIFFAPGLEYDFSLILSADSEDWKSLYINTNNFIGIGMLSALKKASQSDAELDSESIVKIFPKAVRGLTDKNPNLKNMVERKQTTVPLSSVKEMRSATLTLEQCAGIMRDDTKKLASLSEDNKKELRQIILDDRSFQPRLEISDGEYFGFPKDTRMFFINTPTGLLLMLAKEKGHLRIFWTSFVAD